MKAYIINLIRKHPISIFFIVTYTISWAIWIPLISLGDSQFRMLGTFGPIISVLILTMSLEGKLGVKRLFRKFVMWQESYFWYLFSFLSTGVVVYISIGIYRLIGGQKLQFNDLSQWYLIIIIFLYVLFLSVLGEEAGWRGFVLPRLQQCYSALTSSLIIGILWALWHLPLFFIKGDFHESIPIMLFVIQGVVLSIVYTWIYNNTNGSLLFVHLFHAASNVTLGILPVLPMNTGGDIRPLWITVIILIIVAVFIVLKYGPENLSRMKRITE